MFADYERTKNICAAVQSIVVSLAVLIGGVWTAWEFYQLDQVGQAEADLKAKKHAADAKAIVNIELRASNVEFDKSKFINVQAVLRNDGGNDAYLDYSNPVLSFSRLTVGESNTISFGKPVVSHIFMPGGHIPNALIRNGEIKEYPFALPVQKPGVYLIRFAAKVSEQDKRTPSSNKDYDGEWSHQIIHTVD